ncbi:DegT/DnrJ/EryC1/StrS family aminotransferase [Spirochaeta cellobiosiphila]|uniref:DegT/DnrJ/EryC1/StrS family aminotransferase n=1 Tax=Spirochaeta cellobiosiphila TaxID=504483 RepID=UPI00040F195F|nr:DegT/DnrJ/EryC1/StrS aminotransferase family protein [Spirochaeta cellobiosiphila]
MNQNINSVPFARPFIGEDEEAAVLNVLRSGWLTTGKQAIAFEKDMASYINCSHAIAVNSATSGLHLALKALGIQPGDKVLTSVWTFTATAEVIRYLDADPVFVDIEPNGFNLAIDEVKTKLNEHDIKTIIPVHIGGVTCDMEQLTDLKARHAFTILEDAAHSFPCHNEKGQYAGNRGDIGVYSFYANKTITTGEGGMVITNHDDIAEKIKLYRLHGINKDAFNRYTDTKANWEYDVTVPGYKYNLTDIAAALGRVQLQKAETFRQQRQSIANQYNSVFDQYDFLTCPPNGEGNSWHLYAIKLNLSKLNINRNDFINKLKEAGVGTSVHYKPLHMMTYYRNKYGLKDTDFPRATKAFEEIISLPIFHGMDEEEVNYVINSVLSIGKSHYKG